MEHEIPCSKRPLWQKLGVIKTANLVKKKNLKQLIQANFKGKNLVLSKMLYFIEIEQLFPKNVLYR